MKFEKLKQIALALIVSGGFAAAQTQNPPKPEEKPKPAQDEKAKPVPAASPVVMSKTKAEVAIPVTGLTAENAAKVETALKGLQANLYDCAGCHAKFEKAGSCCNAALKAESQPVVDQATIAADQGKVTIVTKEGMQLRLSDIERALGACSIKIDNSKLTIPGNAVIVVAGVGNDEQAKAIQKSLEEGKFFQRVKVTPATDGTGLVEVTAGTPAASKAKVEESIAKVAPAHKVQDVIWNCWRVEKS